MNWSLLIALFFLFCCFVKGRDNSGNSWSLPFTVGIAGVA